jgi:hypothetical protein
VALAWDDARNHRDQALQEYRHEVRITKWLKRAGI